MLSNLAINFEQIHQPFTFLYLTHHLFQYFYKKKFVFKILFKHLFKIPIISTTIIHYQQLPPPPLPPPTAPTTMMNMFCLLIETYWSDFVLICYIDWDPFGLMIVLLSLIYFFYIRSIIWCWFKGRSIIWCWFKGSVL